MGRLSAPAQTSLDRLKALDALPDLRTQLGVAQQLCNHSARADMIVKWLLGKLKSSQEARRDFASWELLSSAIRLLSKQKTSILLSTNGFMEISRLTCIDPELPSKTIAGLAHLLNLLLEHAQQVGGAALKAVLAIQSESAALICGSWLQHIYNASLGPSTDETVLFNEFLLNPALQIWEMRKRGLSDDDLFNSNCLVPALLLLAHPKGAKLQNPNKRKRDQDSPAPACQRSLESLIAIHTILPARSEFFDTESDATHTQRKGKSHPYRPAIKERLGPLKMALLHGRFPRATAAVPLVLEIALRSVSMPTPKHRFNERPWVETLVKALQSCMASQDSARINEMLASALSIVRLHGLSMSLQFLSELVRNQAMPQKQESSIHWNLIAEVVKMDSNVFTDQSLSDEVFDAATACDNPLGAVEDGFQVQSVSLKDNIIVPIMKAFAKTRKTSDFVAAWHKQLVQANKTAVDSIWTDIAMAFGEDLEDNMSHEQIGNLFDQLSKPLNAWVLSTAEGSSADCSTYTASLVQLYSVLSGVRSDELLARLHTRLDLLVWNMFALKHLHGGGVPDVVLHQLYKLLTRAFELWYPTWVAQHAEGETIAKYGVSFFESSLSLSARKTIAAAPDSKPGCVARILVATMCDTLLQYHEDEECVRLVSEHIRSVGKLAVVIFPTLLDTLDPILWKEMLTESFTKRSLLESTSDRLPSALAAAVVPRGRSSLVESAVSAVLGELKSRSDVYSPLQFLSYLDHTRLAQEQRTAILDALLQLDTVPSIQQHRLSLLLSLLPGARRDVQLLKDVSCIWHLAAFHDRDNIKPATASTSDSAENVQILEQIVKTILESWLGSKEHQWGRDALSQFSKQVKDYIRKTARTGTLSSQPGSLAVTKMAIVLLSDQIPPGYPEKLIHEDEKTIKLFMETLIKEAELLWAFTNSEDAVHDTQRSVSLSLVLDALASMPHSVQRVGCSKELQERLIALVQQAFASNNHTVQHRLCCFQLMHTFGGCSLKSLTELAEQVLESELAAVSQNQLLKVYEAAAQGESTVGKSVVLKDLDRRLLHSPPALLLYRGVVTTIDKVELGRASSLTNNSQFSGSELVDSVLRAALDAKTLLVKTTALQSLVLMIKKQPFLLNQHGVEQAIYTTHQLLEAYPYATGIYKGACEVVAVLFATQRARLQGRFHLLVALFQAFLSALFRPSGGMTSAEASVHHAQTLARLLESFCSPPQARHRGKTSELVDEARKARTHAGQYAQYILHHYCSQILGGTLGDGVREALMPGLWAVIGAIEANNQDGIKSLSAAMNNSERAVLRSVYDDWKRFGKWEGS